MSLALLKQSLLTNTSGSGQELLQGRHDSPQRNKQDLETGISDQDKDYDEKYDSGSESDQSTLLGAPSSEDGRPRKGLKINARVISDAIIGLSDGLTVPFALTAGLSALGNTRVVVFGGLAELTAGAISMGLGGYLGAKSEEQSYRATSSEVRTTIKTSPETVTSAIDDVFAPYDIPRATLESLASHLQHSPKLHDFLLQFQHHAEEPASSRAITCALTIAAGYFVGGFLPLMPYFFVGQNDIMLALWVSIGVMAAALFAFGYAKTVFVSSTRGRRRILEGLYGGLQMMVVGGIAAGSAMALVKLFDTLAGLEGV